MVITGTVAGLTALGGVQAHQHPPHSAAVVHPVTYGMGEAAVPIAQAHLHQARPTTASARPRPAAPGTAAAGHFHFHLLHAYLGWRVLRWLVEPRLRPWWLQG